MGENHCCRACFSSSSLAWGRVEVPFLLLSSLPPPPGGLFSFFFGRPRACSHERKMGNLFSWAKMLLQKGGRCFEGQLALLDSKKIRRCNVILFFEVKLEKCSSTHLIFHSINLSSLVWVSRQGGLYDIHLFSGTGEKRGEGGGYFLFTTSFPLRGWSRWGRRGEGRNSICGVRSLRDQHFVHRWARGRRLGGGVRQILAREGELFLSTQEGGT